MRKKELNLSATSTVSLIVVTYLVVRQGDNNDCSTI